MFLTGPEFLPELREHRGRTLTLIQDAQATGRTRMAEMNTHVLTNLDRRRGVRARDRTDRERLGQSPYITGAPLATASWDKTVARPFSYLVQLRSFVPSWRPGGCDHLPRG